MSKESFLGFLRQAAADKPLKAKVEAATSPSELVALGQEHGHEFAPDHVQATVAEIQAQPGAFAFLSQAILELFSPDHDNYPATGVQPFEGDVNRD